MSTTHKKQPVAFGNYLLLDRINIGGMAEVWRGKTFGAGGFERLVAIKRILPNIAEDDEFKAMFIDEAKISVQLTHANIAQVHDLGQIGNSLFIAMEYIPGKDLRAIFDRSRKKGEPAPIPLTCYVISKLCDALDYAHRKKDGMGRDMNIVHRDVSPQNVLISFDGDVKVIDFGIAKAAGKATKTQAGILKGKFGYMSPEQIRGLPLDRRSDIFAIGVCLYEMLTGERLFVGDSDFSVLEKVRRAEVLAPSTYNRRVPDALERVVMRALAKDVDLRYQYASELFKDLQPFAMTPDVFTQRDLAQYMKSTFVEDVEREKARILEYADVKLPPPGPSRAETPTHPQPAVVPLVSPSSLGEAGGLANIIPTSSQSRALTQVAQSPRPVSTPAPPELPRRATTQGAFPKLTPANLDPEAERDVATQLVPQPGGVRRAVVPELVSEPPTRHDRGQTPAAGIVNVARPGVMTPTSPATPSAMPPSSAEVDPAPNGTMPLLPAVRPSRDSIPEATPVSPPSLAPPRRHTVNLGLPTPVRLVAAAAIGLLLVLSGAVVGYILRASATGYLLIELKPGLASKARLSVNGRDLGTPDSWPVLRQVTPGMVAVKITADGYQPFIETLSVLEGKSPTPLRAELSPTQELSQLVVVTTPETAEVTVGERVVKKEGAKGFRAVAVPTGTEQTVRVSAKGYRVRELKAAAVRTDEPLVLFVPLDAGEFTVQLTSRPEGASIQVGDRVLGKTPTRLRVTPDIVTVTVKRACYEPYELVLGAPQDPSEVPKLDVTLIRQQNCTGG